MIELKNGTFPGSAWPFALTNEPTELDDLNDFTEAYTVRRSWLTRVCSDVISIENVTMALIFLQGLKASCELKGVYM